ncbi:hypothetical protein XENE109146_18480 [Xenorhabdus nematophila]
MPDAVQPMMAVFADFRWLVAVPKIRGAASRLLTRFFDAPPEGIVAVFPLLATRCQHAGQLILAVPAVFSQLWAMAFLPQLHGGHPACLIVFE